MRGHAALRDAGAIFLQVMWMERAHARLKRDTPNYISFDNGYHSELYENWLVEEVFGTHRC